MNKAFFLDRDGTINEDYDFVHKKEEWDFCTGAIEFIRWLNEHDYKVIVITNQSGIARGHFSLEQVHNLHNYVDELLQNENAHIDEWCIAYWHPKFHEGLNPDLLDYRKPGKRYFLEMMEKYNLDPKQCFMAGDKPSDLKPAIELGMKTYYIKSRFHEKNDHNWLNENNLKPYDNLQSILEELRKD